MEEEKKEFAEGYTSSESTTSAETTTEIQVAENVACTVDTTTNDAFTKDADSDTFDTPPVIAIPVEEISKKKRKKLPIIVGIIVALIVIVATVVIKPGQGGKISVGSKAETNTCIFSKHDADGVAYIPLMNGNITQIDNDVSKSCVTPDRKHVVVLTKDKVLYYAGANQSEKTQISENGNSILTIADKGVLYSDSDGDYHRYLFADESDVNIGEVDSYCESAANFNIAFNVNSSVYMLAENAQEKEKIGNVTNDCGVLYVSDDGGIVYWDDYKDYEETIFVYENGEKRKAGTFETSSEYANAMVTYNESNKFAIITNLYADTLIVVPDIGEPLRCKLGGELASDTIYTTLGLIEEDTSSSFSGIYVRTEGSDGNNLYYIDAKGEREKVLSNVGTYTIYENYLYYVDEDDNLKVAKLTDETLSDEEKVTGDAEIMNPTCINGYIYFVKDCNSEDETGILYAYKRGADPVEVTSDVLFGLFESVGYFHGGISTDGKTIYFIKEPTDISDTYSSYGVLYKYTYGDYEPTKIASDVVSITLDSGYVSGVLNDKSFIYLKYSSVKNGKVIGDWYYFDGTDSVKMASDVIID